MEDSHAMEPSMSSSAPRSEKRDRSVPLTAHLCLLGAASFWGLMAPLGKDAMTHGFDGIDMVSFRVAGGALLFWIASLFTRREHIAPRHIALLCLAAVFGIVGNQCCFTIGLSMTSPINAGIATTSMPIFSLVLSALVLREPVTWRKAVGVAFGCAGALLLVWSSARAAGVAIGTGNLCGDLLCLAAQFSYSIYLTVFGWLAKRYSVVTVNKWMFLSATCIIWPFTGAHVLSTPWAEVPLKTYAETAYVVVCGTFAAYLLMIRGQQVLRPTVVSMYNYVQPIVAALVSILLGLAVLTVTHAVAAALIFTGVAMVTLSKSRRDLEQAARHATSHDAAEKGEQEQRD